MTIMTVSIGYPCAALGEDAPFQASI